MRHQHCLIIFQPCAVHSDPPTLDLKKVYSTICALPTDHRDSKTIHPLIDRSPLIPANQLHNQSSSSSSSSAGRSCLNKRTTACWHYDRRRRVNANVISPAARCESLDLWVRELYSRPARAYSLTRRNWPPLSRVSTRRAALFCACTASFAMRNFGLFI